MIMMIKLTYKDFTFPENPSDISIKKSKKINTCSLPGAGSAVEETSRNASVISISGRFYGEDREMLASRLCELHDQCGAGALYLPGGEFFNAFFSELSLKRNASENCISYGMAFIEDDRYKKARFSSEHVRARSGENAFDIANRCGVSVEEIIEKNSLKTPFDIREGQEVSI